MRRARPTKQQRVQKSNTKKRGSGKFGVKQRTPEQVTKDRALIAELQLEGHTINEMATIVGISFEQTCYELREIEEEWKKSGIADTHLFKTQQVKRMEKIYNVAWKLLRASQKGRTITKNKFQGTKKAMKGLTGKKHKATVHKKLANQTLQAIERIEQNESSYGDPQLLSIAMAATMNLCRIGGILADGSGDAPDPLSNVRARVVILPAQLPPKPAPQIEQMKSANPKT